MPTVAWDENWPELWSNPGLGAGTPTRPPRSSSHSDDYCDNDDVDNDDDDADADDVNGDGDDGDELPEASCSAQSQFLGCCEQAEQRGKQMSEISKSFR